MKPAEAAGVLAAAAGRDRVTDAVKALALCLVIVGHGLAWTTLPDGTVVNTLEVAPDLYWLTWVIQILPLFFVLAGQGLLGLVARGDATGYYRRIDRLVSPTLPLLLVTVALAAVVGLTMSSGIASAAAGLPTQLVWFVGVYLLIVACSPILTRASRLWHFAAWLAAIGGIDWLRVNVDERLGWANLLLVWALFSALGMNLAPLRAARATTLAVGALASAATAAVLIVVGPYSAALVSTPAVPGISNLAPPTLVLAFAGLAQTFVLLLGWRGLAALLARDRVWVPVAVVSSRAMELYLFQMLFIGVGIAVVHGLGLAPTPLGAGWWALHLIVFAGAVSAIWLLAPLLRRAAAWIAATAGLAVPSRAVERLGTASSRWARALAAVAGLNLLLISESGLGDVLGERTVIWIPYVPLVSMIILIASAALGSRIARRPPRGDGRRIAR